MSLRYFGKVSTIWFRTIYEYLPLSSWAVEKFNHNFNDYDRAIDAVYNSTHMGGASYHHLLDGQHSILGVFNAVKDVKANDSSVTEFLQAGEHLLRDMASISGINPFFSLTSEQFSDLALLMQPLGISKPFLADALTINAPELVGGVIALLSTIILGKKAVIRLYKMDFLPIFCRN